MFSTKELYLLPGRKKSFYAKMINAACLKSLSHKDNVYKYAQTYRNSGNRYGFYTTNIYFTVKYIERWLRLSSFWLIAMRVSACIRAAGLNISSRQISFTLSLSLSSLCISIHKKSHWIFLQSYIHFGLWSATAATVRETKHCFGIKFSFVH